jgi:hypothetical protein
MAVSGREGKCQATIERASDIDIIPAKYRFAGDIGTGGRDWTHAWQSLLCTSH